MKRITLIYIFLTCQILIGVGLNVPSLAEMLARSNSVLVGSITLKNEKCYIEVKKILKGSLKVGEFIEIRSNNYKGSFNTDTLQRRVKDDDFLFVGEYNTENKYLSASFGIASVWPQGLISDSDPFKTLNEAIIFAQKSLIDYPVSKNPGQPSFESLYPTPTIAPTLTPTPSPTPTPKISVNPLPSPTPASLPVQPSPKPSQQESPASGSSVWLMLAAAVSAAVLLIFWFRRKSA